MRLLFVLAVVCVAVFAEEDSQILKNYAAGQAEFTAKVYKEILKNGTNNFVASPLSANVILALVHNGANGKTAQQLATGLNLPNNKEQIQQIFQKVIPHLQGNNQYNLTSANKVYLKEGFEISEQFKNTAVNVFGSDVQGIDFEKTEQAASEINEWVEGRTNSKIKDLITADSLDEYTRAVLINTLYFEGKWNKPFDSRFTSKRGFYFNKAKKDIDMMEQVEHFNYYECSELNAKFLELPYKGGELSMTIVLPNNNDGLLSLEDQLSANVFVAPQYKKERVHVVLPKLKTETSIELKPILQSLGIVDAFENYADLTGIGAHAESLKITKVTQKAFVEVEEEGTTAAAATSVLISKTQSGHAHADPKEFVADHPFIYYISSPAGILFVGRHIDG